MSICKCEYPGPLGTPGHRRFHERWASMRDETTLPTGVKATIQEVTDIYRVQDELIAWAWGGPKPSQTPGAQALLVKQAQERT